jgi:hypothetical protein
MIANLDRGGILFTVSPISETGVQVAKSHVIKQFIILTSGLHEQAAMDLILLPEDTWAKSRNPILSLKLRLDRNALHAVSSIQTSREGVTHRLATARANSQAFVHRHCRSFSETINMTRSQEKPKKFDFLHDPAQ